jgi:hypothetical protein
MEFYQQIFLTGCFTLLALIAVFQLTGYLLHSLFLNRGVGENNLIPFHGLLFWVLLTAMVVTGGKTICWTIALYFMAVFWMPPIRKKALNLPDGVKSVLSIWLFAMIPFTVFYSFTFRYTNTITLPFMDEIFYAKVAAMLMQTGVETNITQSLWFEELASVTPYHYFELWLTALLQYTCAYFPTLLTFKLLAIPVMLGVALYLLYGTARIYGLTPLSATVSVLVFLFCGLFLGYTSLTGKPIKEVLAVQLHYISDFVVLNRTKLATILLFIAASGTLYARANRFWFMPLLCLSFLWVTVMPSMLSMVGVGLLFQHRRLLSKAYVLPLIYFFLSMLLFWYLYLSPFSNATFDNSITFFQYSSPNMLIGTVVYELISHAIILIPAILLAGWLIIARKQSIDASVFLLLVPVAVGIILHTATVGSVNSFQFVSNISAIALPMIYFYLMVAFFSKKRNVWEIGCIVVLIGVQGYFTFKTLAYSFENYNETYGTSFLEDMSRKTDESDNKVVALIEPKGGHHDAPFTNIEGAFFLLFNSEAKICQLNAEVALQNMSERNFSSIVAAAPFLYFCNKNNIKDYAQCRLEFIDQFMPDYLVVPKGVNLNRYPELNNAIQPFAADPISRVQVFKFKSKVRSETR